MSNFSDSQAAEVLISLKNNVFISMNNNLFNEIHNQVIEERKKKENFEYEFKSISKKNLNMIIELFEVNKEIKEIKKNNFFDNIIINNKNKIINNIKNKNENTHNYNLRPRNKN